MLLSVKLNQAESLRFSRQAALPIQHTPSRDTPHPALICGQIFTDVAAKLLASAAAGRAP